MHSYGSDAYRCLTWHDLSLTISEDQRTVLAVPVGHVVHDGPHAVDVATGAVRVLDEPVSAHATAAGRVVAVPRRNPSRVIVLELPDLKTERSLDLGGPVTAVAVRGGLLAVAVADPYSLVLVDLSTWVERRVELPVRPVCLTVADDLPVVAVGCGQERTGRVVVVDVDTASVSYVLTGARAPIGSVVLSPAADRVTASTGKSVLTWPLGGRSPSSTTVHRSTDTQRLIGVTRAGLVLVSGRESALTAVDPASATTTWSVDQYGSAAAAGDRVVSARFRTLRELDPATGAVLHQWDLGCFLGPVAVADGLVALSTGGARVDLLRVGDTPSRTDAPGHDREVTSYTFDGDRFATAAPDDRVCVWRRGVSEPERVLSADCRGGLHLHGDDLYTGDGCRVRRLSLSDGRLTARSDELKSPAVLIHPLTGTGLVLVATEASRRRYGMLHLLDSRTLETLSEHRVEESYLVARRLDDDRVELTGGLHQAVFDLSTRTLTVGPWSSRGWDRHDLVSADRSLLVSTRNTRADSSGWRGAVTAVDLTSDEPLYERVGIPEVVGRGALSGRDVLATPHRDAIRLWDARTGTPRGELPAPPALGSLRFVPDGQALLAAGRNGSLHEIPL